MPVKKPDPADLEPIERAPRAELLALQFERMRWSLRMPTRTCPLPQEVRDAR
jgi:phenylacetate-CoA ligase